MTRLDIVEKGNIVLETVAKEVPVAEITSQPIQKIISDMKETLDAISDGVGLAAPQVGESLRIFLVSKKILKRNAKHKSKHEQESIDDLVCINPKIIKVSRKTQDMQEGCLSVRWIYGTTKRHVGATVEAFDELG